MEYLSLEKIGAYKNSFQLSNYVWDIVIKWEAFARKTIGEQFADSVDSISANIAEGFGRYHKRDKVKFYYNSRGSVQESIDWMEKARIRRLIDKEQYGYISSSLQKLPREIHRLINYTMEKLKE